MNKFFLVLQIPNHAKDVFTNLPTFGRLNYLQINEIDGEALLHLLYNSPILKTIILLHVSLIRDLSDTPRLCVCSRQFDHDWLTNQWQYFQGVSKFDKDIWISASVPHCFQSYLKVFQFGGFNVYVHELSLAKFVMENAAKLERMTITTAFWLQYSDINMDKVKEQLLSFPKCSTSVSLEFADVNGSSR